MIKTEHTREAIETSSDAVRQEERSAWYAGWRVTFIATGEETGQKYSLTEVRGRRNHSDVPPMHIHTREEESFYVLEGSITCYVGDDVFDVPAGSFISLPRDVPHRYEIGSEEVTLLNLCVPAGFEHFYMALSEPAAGPGLPPAPDGPRDIARLLSVAAQHGIQIVVPKAG